jgi:hypothetical protein
LVNRQNGIFIIKREGNGYCLFSLKMAKNRYVSSKEWNKSSNFGPGK